MNPFCADGLAGLWRTGRETELINKVFYVTETFKTVRWIKLSKIDYKYNFLLITCPLYLFIELSLLRLRATFLLFINIFKNIFLFTYCVYIDTPVCTKAHTSKFVFSKVFNTFVKDFWTLFKHNLCWLDIRIV